MDGFGITREQARSLIEDSIDSPIYTGEIREDVQNMIGEGRSSDYYQGLAAGLSLVHYVIERMELAEEEEAEDGWDDEEAIFVDTAALASVLNVFLLRACLLWNP